jgi:hypothetical protein
MSVLEVTALTGKKSPQRDQLMADRYRYWQFAAGRSY